MSIVESSYLYFVLRFLLQAVYKNSNSHLQNLLLYFEFTMSNICNISTGKNEVKLFSFFLSMTAQLQMKELWLDCYVMHKTTLAIVTILNLF